MSLIKKLESEIGVVEGELQGIAALVWRDVKSAAAAGGAVVEAEVKAAIPKFAAAVKDYAAQVVGSIEVNPAFAGAVGDWKFGAACAMVFQAVKAGLPGFEKAATALAQSTVESAVQDGVSAMLVGATANPTSSAAKP